MRRKVVDGLADNVAAVARHGDAAATEAAFARAAVRVAVDIVNQRVAPSPIEPRTVLADFDGQERAADDSHVEPDALGRAHQRVRCAGLNPDDVRVLVGDVGGGFGMKTGAYPEDLALAYAARK